MIQQVKCFTCGQNEQIHIVNSVLKDSYPGKTRSWICQNCHAKNVIDVYSSYHSISLKTTGNLDMPSDGEDQEKDGKGGTSDW